MRVELLLGRLNGDREEGRKVKNPRRKPGVWGTLRD